MSLNLCFTGEAGFVEVGSWYGASSVGSIGDLLSVDTLDFGPAITEIELVMHYAIRPGFFQRKGWAKPPPEPKKNLRRFHRKKAKLEIRWVSPRRTSKSALGFIKESHAPEAFHLDFDDVVDALTYGTGTLKSSDDFNLPAFLDFLNQQRILDRGSDVDIRTALENAAAIARARYEERDPWDKLDVDWDEMHPNARAILDDPKDWSQGDDFAPHGNDTGADILAEWATYAPLSPEQAAAEIGWGPEFDLANDLCWKDWVEINLGLAFGHIKKSGTCPKSLATSALSVLRQEYAKAETQTSLQHRLHYLNGLARYISILECYD